MSEVAKLKLRDAQQRQRNQREARDSDTLPEPPDDETVRFAPPSGEADSAEQMIFALHSVMRVIEGAEHGHYSTRETSELSERAGLIAAARILAEQLATRMQV